MYTSKHVAQTPKFSNKRLTQEQAQLLETSFKFNPKLDVDRKYHLAQQLNLSARQVAVWYQNKRARWKSQSLEMDYKALQQRLEGTLAQNERLEREVQRLRQELEGAHQQLLFMSNSSSSSKYSSGNCKYSCEEEGSSSLLVGESSSGLASELFACLIGNNIEGKL